MMKKNDSRVKRKTSVWWDMDGCPIPENYDASLIGAKIDTALMNSGYSGPLTITSVGDDLRDISDEVLRGLSSAGIRIKECDLGYLLLDLLDWADVNEPPATIMLITNNETVMNMCYPLEKLEKKGYKILVVCPRSESLILPFPRGRWLWKTILKAAIREYSDTTRMRPVVVSQKEDLFVCKGCKCEFAGQCVEKFIDHLRGREHVLNLIPKSRREDDKEKKAVVDPYLTYANVTCPDFQKNARRREKYYEEYAVVDDALEEEYMYDYATRLGGSRIDEEWPLPERKE